VVLSSVTVDVEVGKIFAGLKPSLVSERTVFKSVGIAAEEIATATLVFDTASQNPK
jgi:thiomorpholine-carboxylate dehydrogenase